MKATIIWSSKNVLLGKRAFLFCFGEKCMSGKIIELKQINTFDQFEIIVNFIEPDFFEVDLVIGNHFTIRESSKILGEGQVTGIM